MKLKHNKKRNTAFLFEALVREITKCAVNDDKEGQKQILLIIKEFFSKQSILNQELKLYKSILETKNLDKNTAERVLTKTVRQYEFLDKQKIFETQSKLIKRVNKTVGNDIYSNFVPNYKYVATVYQILNGDLGPKTHVMMENEIVDYMSSPSVVQEQKKSDKMVFKVYLDKFNQKYSSALNESQKTLLSHYINSYNDNGMELKLYLNEEIERLSLVIQNNKNENLQPKLKEVSKLIESFKATKFDDKLLKKVLQIQQLVGELETNEG